MTTHYYLVTRAWFTEKNMDAFTQHVADIKRRREQVKSKCVAVHPNIQHPVRRAFVAACGCIFSPPNAELKAMRDREAGVYTQIKKTRKSGDGSPRIKKDGTIDRRSLRRKMAPTLIEERIS